MNRKLDYLQNTYVYLTYVSRSKTTHYTYIMTVAAELASLAKECISEQLITPEAGEEFIDYAKKANDYAIKMIYNY